MGNVGYQESPADFPASKFSFSPSNRFGPARKLAHPQLHPTRFQRKPGDVMIHVPAKGPLPRGSFCGADGYGLIHPNLISAAVLQCCIASSQESTNHFKFDAMALAPNMDLLMSCKDAERIAQTIVQWNCGHTRTDKMELTKPPGGNMPKDVKSKLFQGEGIGKVLRPWETVHCERKSDKYKTRTSRIL